MRANKADSAVVIELVVGTYSQQGSDGIYHLRFRPGSGLSEPQLLIAVDNPSYMAMDGNRVYAVNELDPGQLSVIEWKDQARLLASAWTRGAAPCYVSISPDGQYLATANYNGGSVSIFQILENGDLNDEPRVLTHTGDPGPARGRQGAPHAHWVQWTAEGDRVYAVDLGTDDVVGYLFDAATGEIAPGATALKLRPGDGPRHLFFHPSLAVVYVLNELSNTVVVASRALDGSLTEIQRVSTLPGGFDQHSQAAHLEVSPDGLRLYASNRGHDSIATFAIDADGSLTWMGTRSTGGRWPRHFLLLPEAGVVIVANQESGRLSLLPIESDGVLGPAQASVPVPQPTFVGRRPS